MSMFCWRAGVPGSSAAALETREHLQSMCQGSKLVNCPPGPIPNPPPAPSLILGFSPWWLDSPPGNEIYLLSLPQGKTKIILFSFHPTSPDPEAKQERSGGSSGHESPPPCLSPTLLLKQVVLGMSQTSPHPGHQVPAAIYISTAS